MSEQTLIERFSERLDQALQLLTRSRGPEYDTPRPVVLARVEDDRSDFPKDQRISARLFADLIETYDPERRQAPVVVGFFDTGSPGVVDTGTPGIEPVEADRVVAGPSHWVGEYLPPLGFIRGTDWHLDRDHLNLFGMVTQIVDADGVGRVDRMVSRGFLQRSIAFIPKTNETGGKPDLWHFAVLAGEQPGIPNMPTLDRSFGLGVADRSRDWQALGLTARALREVNYRTLDILDGMHQEQDMTPEDRAALAKELAGALAGVVSPLVESINRSTERQEKAFVDFGAALRTEVKAVETKADDAAAESRKVADKAKETADAAAVAAIVAADDAKKATDKAKAEHQRSIEQRLVAVVKSGRAQPAHVSRVAATFEKAGDEAIEAALATLESLPVIDRNGSMPTEIKAEGHGAVLVNFEQRYTQPGMGHRLDVSEVEVMQGLMRGVMHLPTEQRRSALNAAILNHYDGAVAGNALGF